MLLQVYQLKPEHITPILISLHLASSKQRLDFNLNISYLKSLNSLGPSYIVVMLTEYTTLKFSIVD